MSGTELAKRDAYQVASLDDRWRYAQAISQAGNLVPPGLRDGNAMNPGKVLMAMEQATVLGFHPMVGVNNINVIDGKVSIPPALMQAAVRNAGHKLRVQKDGTVEGGDYSVTVTLIRSDDPDAPFTATWTPHRAARAGLCTYVQEGGKWAVRATSRSGSPLPWQNYTEALCKARAISEVVMEGATDVMMGSVYTPEELGAEVDEAGVIVVGGDERVDFAGGNGKVLEAQPSQPAPANATQAATGPDEGKDEPDPAVVEAWRNLVAACETRKDLRTVWDDVVEAGAMGLELEPGVTLREAMLRAGSLMEAAENAAATAAEVAGDDATDGGEQDGQE